MAKRNKDITLEDFRRNNGKLFFFNILVIIISIVCAGSLLLKSFWKIEFSATLDGETINSFLGEESSDFDLSKLENDIKFSASVDITPALMQDALSAETDKQRIKMFLDPVVADLMAQTRVAIKSLVSVAVQMGMDTAMEKIQEQVSEESVDKIKGVDTSSVTSIVEEAFAGELNNEMAKAEIIKIINSQIEGLDIPQADKERAIASVEENLETVFDEHFATITDGEGYLDPTKMVENMIGEMLGLREGEFSDADVIDKLYSQLSPSAKNGINYAVLGLAIVWAVCIVAWLWLALFATLRLVRRRKGASFFLPRLVGWIPGVLLWLLPTGAVLLIAKQVPKAAEILKLFNITFMSVGGLVSLAGAVLLMLIGWMGYKKAKKITKKYRA